MSASLVVATLIEEIASSVAEKLKENRLPQAYLESLMPHPFSYQLITKSNAEFARLEITVSTDNKYLNLFFMDHNGDRVAQFKIYADES